MLNVSTRWESGHDNSFRTIGCYRHDRFVGRDPWPLHCTEPSGKQAATGIGWLQANLSLTPFNSIVAENPWGSSGDLRILPDLKARYRTDLTGGSTPFDMVAGDIVDLDGNAWLGCTRSMLRKALADLKALTGLSLVSTFEQEFQIFGGNFPQAHSLSMEALRRTDPFAPQLMAALEEAGVAPEVIIAEFGEDQFEVTHAPTDGLTAADRAVAIREITREVARNLGWKASFAPKTAPNAVGNGVHIHFSFVDEKGNRLLMIRKSRVGCRKRLVHLRGRSAPSARNHRVDRFKSVFVLPSQAT